MLKRPAARAGPTAGGSDAKHMARSSFYKRHFVKAVPGKRSRGLDAWRRSRVDMQLEEEAEPLRGDALIQNSAGVLVAGQLPVVQSGMEDRTIAVQMTFGCCCSHFDVFYQRGHLLIKQDEFESAVEELNTALRAPPVWALLFAPCCFMPCCWKDRALRRKTEALNRRFADRGVRFSTTTRLYQGMQADNLIGKEMNYKMGTYLIVEQHEPPAREMQAVAAVQEAAGPSSTPEEGEGADKV